MRDLIFGTLTLDPVTVGDFDMATEFARLQQRQRAIQGCLDGTVSPDYLLDMLMEHSIEVEEYVNEVEENVEWVINNVR